MTTTPYIPKPNSKVDKVLQFFQDNPDEALSPHEIAVKFGIVRGQVHTLLRPSIDAEFLARTRDELGEYVYKAGTRLGEYNAPETPAPEIKPVDTLPHWPTAPKGRAAAGGTQRGKRKLMLDLRQIAALPVDTDVPFHATRSREGEKWEPLFSKLTEPGHSVQFPVEWKTAVAATAMKLNRKTKNIAWRVRQVSDTHARLWRLAK